MPAAVPARGWMMVTMVLGSVLIYAMRTNLSIALNSDDGMADQFGWVCCGYCSCSACCGWRTTTLGGLLSPAAVCSGLCPCCRWGDREKGQIQSSFLFGYFLMNSCGRLAWLPGTRRPEPAAAGR